MGYCKICRQHLEDPFDCDCRCERCYAESDGDTTDCLLASCPGHEDQPPTLEQFLAGCVADCIEGTA